MNWRIKAHLQRSLSAIPGGCAINDWLQRSVEGLRNFEARVDSTVISDWTVLVSYMKQVGLKPQSLDYVEVGTGWYPTLSICFSLIGARSCQTFGIATHLNSQLTFRMLWRLAEHLPEIAKAGDCPLHEVRQSFEMLVKAKTVGDLLWRARVKYIAPADTTASLPDASVDVFYSNNLLEHLPPEAILAMMRESRRILRPDGIALHSADCGDHYAYFDRSITFINYLTYTDQEWRFWNNPLLYQNRLRPMDYQRLAEKADLRILRCHYRTRPESIKALPTMTISPDFVNYPPDQLCATSVGLVAQR